MGNLLCPKRWLSLQHVIIILTKQTAITVIITGFMVAFGSDDGSIGFYHTQAEAVE